MLDEKVILEFGGDEWSGEIYCIGTHRFIGIGTRYGSFAKRITGVRASDDKVLVLEVGNDELVIHFNKPVAKEVASAIIMCKPLPIGDADAVKIYYNGTLFAGTEEVEE